MANVRIKINSIDFSHLTQAEIGAAFGLKSGSAVGRWQGCPRNKDKTYSLPEVIAWRMDLAAHEDADLAGGPSPTQERYRQAKAELAELDLAQRQARVIETHVIHAGFAHIAKLLRRAGERMQKKGEVGQSCHALLEAALEDADRTIKEIVECM